MVPKAIAKANTRIVKLLWDNVAWVGPGMERKTVSCLAVVKERDVSLTEIGEGGVLTSVCREEFKAPISDCVFQAWVPRLVYLCPDGVGEIHLNFEAKIRTTKHVYHRAFNNNDVGASDDKLASDAATPHDKAASDDAQNPTTPNDKAASDLASNPVPPTLTCLGTTGKNLNRVLVGDDKGYVYTFGGARASFARKNDLTFPFPLAKLAMLEKRSVLYFVGLSAASKAPAKDSDPEARSSRTKESQPTAGVLRVDSGPSALPVFQAVGEGRVLGLSCYQSATQPILSTVEEGVGLVHHSLQHNADDTPVKAFAVKPVDTLSGECAWGSGGWLAYVREGGVVLEREPRLHGLVDE